jgi:hypothetical protein
LIGNPSLASSAWSRSRVQWSRRIGWFLAVAGAARVTLVVPALFPTVLGMVATQSLLVVSPVVALACTCLVPADSVIGGAATSGLIA